MSRTWLRRWSEQPLTRGPDRTGITGRASLTTSKEPQRIRKVVDRAWSAGSVRGVAGADGYGVAGADG